MSGVYVKDWVVPYGCAVCPFEDFDNERLRYICVAGWLDIDERDHRHPDCPLLIASELKGQRGIAWPPEGSSSIKVYPDDPEWTEDNKCSRCGAPACAGYDEEPWLTRYCPHCGVKMKNPEEYE